MNHHTPTTPITLPSELMKNVVISPKPRQSPIGVVVGPLLLLMVVGALNGLANTHVGGKRNVVDATFQRDEEQDRME